MSRLSNKVHFRGTLRKLSAAAGSSGDAAQEALDFLAMLAGIKPVFLLGRGHDDPAWIAGVLDIARSQNLHVVEGPFWDAGVGYEALPGWYRDHLRSAFSGRTAWYVCRSRAAAEEAAEICKGTASPTVEQEARLLGYPECCVEAHYARGLAYQKVWLSILARAAAGDEAEMRRLLADGASFDPETEEERCLLEAAMAIRPCRFTSINMCDSCASDDDSPARRLSKRYADLAAAVDRGLFTALSARSGATRAPALPPGG
jgi:hypothetical protein